MNEMSSIKLSEFKGQLIDINFENNFNFWSYMEPESWKMSCLKRITEDFKTY